MPVVGTTNFDKLNIPEMRQIDLRMRHRLTI
jgi:hypothetical protein